MKVLKKEMYMPTLPIQDMGKSNFVGHVLIPAKKATEAIEAIPAQKAKKGTNNRPSTPAKPAVPGVPAQPAQDSFYFDYFVGENFLFWARDGDVVFAVHRKGVNWIAPEKAMNVWQFNGYFASGQDTKLSVNVPDGYDFDTIINHLMEFYNK